MRRTEGAQQCGKREMRGEDDQSIKTRKNGCLDITTGFGHRVSWHTSLAPAILKGKHAPVPIAFSLSARKSRLPILMGIPLETLGLLGFGFDFSVGTHHRDKAL